MINPRGNSGDNDISSLEDRFDQKGRAREPLAKRAVAYRHPYWLRDRSVAHLTAQAATLVSLRIRRPVPIGLRGTVDHPYRPFCLVFRRNGTASTRRKANPKNTESHDAGAGSSRRRHRSARTIFPRSAMAVQNELVVAGVGDDAARLAQHITTPARAGRS